MKRHIILGCLIAAAWAGAVVPASAAWNNVFQPTFFGLFRKQQTTANYYTPPVVVQSSPVVAYSPPVVAYSAPCCTPQPQCSTSYQQRCYYEPVTTYQTSYYYEPVSSYRYSAYFDPCSCSYQQVATPVTSYQPRAKSC